MGAFARLPELERGASGDHLLAEINEGCQELAQGELFRTTAVQGQHVTAEIGLHRGEAEELVQHHLGSGIAFQLDHHAHAVAVAFVLNMGDAFDLLVAHLFGNLLDHRGLVHLIGDLVDDDGVAILANLLDPGLGADDDAATPFEIGLARARAAQHEATGGKIGAGDILDQLLGGQVRVLDQGEAGLDHFAQIMGRDIGRHADRNAAGAVDQHVGKTRRKDRRLLILAVIIVLKINGFLIDVGQHKSGGFIHPHFGIAHGGGVIAVHRAEIALAVQQRQRHREILRHPHQRVIDRAVAMGVVFPHHIAHRAGRFAIGFVVRVPGLVHGIENAAMHRFQPVAQVGDRTGDDHAHRIVEIARFHLVGDRDGRAVIGRALGQIFFFVFRCFRGVAHVICRPLFCALRRAYILL